MGKIVSACTRNNPRDRPSMKQIKENLLKILYFKLKAIPDLNKYFAKERIKDKVYLYNKITVYLTQFRSIMQKYNLGKLIYIL